MSWPDHIRHIMETHIPFNQFLGIRVAKVDKGQVRMEIGYRPELIGDSSRGAIHGGVLSTLADTAGGAAVWSAVEDVRARVQTIDLRVDYLRPGKAELIVAEAAVVRIGRRVGVVDVRMFHPSAPEDTIATAKGVYNIGVPKAVSQ
jgi:uncharacterized protein (TIGR00369 family)